MSLTPLIRWGGYMVALAGLLLLVSVLPIPFETGDFRDADLTFSERFTTATFLCGAIFLTLGLPGIYLVQAKEVGRFGLGAYFTALAGSALMIASDWSDVFVHPALVQFPAFQEQAPPEMMTGFVVNYAFYTIGWLLLGIASLRARVLPRWALVLLLAGIVVQLVAANFIPFYLAFIWLGLATARKADEVVIVRAEPALT